MRQKHELSGFSLYLRDDFITCRTLHVRQNGCSRLILAWGVARK